MLLYGFAPRIQRCLNLLLDFIDTRTGCRALLGGKLAQALQQSCQTALLAEVTCLNLLQFGRLINGGKLLHGLAQDLLKFLHNFSLVKQFNDRNSSMVTTTGIWITEQPQIKKEA